MSVLYEKVVAGNHGEGNEISQIERAYGRIISENYTLHNKIATREEALQNYYLLSLMKGSLAWLQNDDDILVNLEQEESLVLVAFLLPSFVDGNPEELLFFVMDNIFSEMMEGERFYRMEDGRYLFYLFCTQRTEAWKEQCLMRASYLCDMIEEKWEITVLAAVSGWESEIKAIRLQYQEVRDTLEYKENFGVKGVTDAREWMSNKGIVNEIVEYVELHYMDPNLNVNAVAEGIKRNSKYISKVFKEETGRSILDYIHNLRIRKAKLLMKAGGYSLEEISEKVGYASVMTFRRSFVKIVGMTPGEYKKD